MTKMATTPIYGKNPLKIFPGTKGPMTLGLGMQYWGLGPNKVCSNDDLHLFLQQGQICFLRLFYMEKYTFLQEKC